MSTDRAARLKRKARWWKVLGSLAFIIGAVLIFERVSYNMHDFYAENYERPTAQELADYGLISYAHLESALSKMEAGQYWDAITDLETLKNESEHVTQVTAWYKILCHIGLEEKEEAIRLLEYYAEQPDFNFKKAEASQLLRLY